MSHKKNTLDFIIIGAAKAGTTPLYKYMSQHPQISIPPGKEVSFFSDDKIYSKGYEWYLQQISVGKKENSLIGTVTPQYMMGQNETFTETVAKRIKKTCPEVKIIAILRDPIDRAFSQYKMSFRRGYEKRSFENAMDDLIKNRKSIKKVDPKSQIILGSEYGENLEHYYKMFDRKQILVIFSEDLRLHPKRELKKIYKFLGVATDSDSKDIGKTVHQGGFKPKAKILTPGVLYKIPGLKLAWNKLVPYPLKKRIEFGVNAWNVKPDDVTLDKGNNSYKNMVSYFKNDVRQLEKLIGLQVPWKEFTKK